MDKHEVIVALKDLALELGRTPKRSEFISRISNGQMKIENLFGSYITLVTAAGLESSQEQRTRNKRGLTNAIFIKDIDSVIEQYEPREPEKKIVYAPTLIIPDTHFPFVNNRLLEKIYRFTEKHAPQRIIQVGDLYDMYAHSKFPRSQNIYMPKQEEELGRSGAEEMWKTLKSYAPNAECVQLKGNHDIRPLRRTLESMPSLEHFVEEYLNKIMRFDGVTLIEDHRQEYYFDDVEVIHGYRSNLGAHRDFALMNAICGHMHVGGVVFRRIKNKTLFELNCGLAGAPESKVFGYTPQKISTGTPGVGWLDEYGPRFIPEELL